MKDTEIIYDLSIIKNKMKFLNDLAEKYSYHIIFPIKTFPETRVLRHALRALSGFDASNAQEKSLIPKGKKVEILWETSPAFDEDIQKFTRAKNHFINVESYLQFKKYSKKIMSNQKISLRISTNALLPKALRSRFGFIVSELDEFKPSERRLIHGLAAHYDSRNKQVNDYLLMAKKLIDIASKYKLKLDFINLGGGFETLTPDNITELFHKLFVLFPDVCFIFEPGRWLSEQAGIVKTIVKDIRLRSNSYHVTVSASALAHFKWCRLVWNGKKLNTMEVHVWGGSCSEGDYLGVFNISRDELPKIGKIMVFSGVSGYASAWNTSFNGLRKIPIKYLN